MKDFFAPKDAPRGIAGALGRFLRNNDGSMATATAILMIPMLVAGGAAVDFMRLEGKRVGVQSCLDQAVLSAASLTNTGTNEEISDLALDWARAGGCESYLIGEPSITAGFGTRSVALTARDPMPTYFIRLAGIDTLEMNARSSAINSVSTTEISLVLDISQSMKGKNRMENMRAAAVSFSETVLDPENHGTVSLNVIPYAGQVNPGPLMFDRMGGVRFDYTNGDEDSDHPYRLHHERTGATVGDEQWQSSCIEMGGGSLNSAEDFSTTGLPTGGPREELVITQHWNYAEGIGQGWGTCPYDKDAIQYARVDAGDADTPGSLVNWLNNLEMYDATGTQYGMKYALALLDPATQSDFAYLNKNGLVPDEFADRPLPWDSTGGQKVIVLMTDGGISHQYRPKDKYTDKNVDTRLGSNTSNRNLWTHKNDAFDDFAEICALAKTERFGIQIYTVAFETNNAQEAALAECASSPAHHFKTSGEDLISVFESIAGEVTQLRVTN